MTAASAYRNDLATNGAPFGDDDGVWIAVASLAEQATFAPPKGAERLLRRAAKMAGALMGRGEVARLATREWGEAAVGIDTLTILGVVLQQAGALNLAASLLDTTLRAAALPADLQFGRMLAQRARVAYLSLDTDAA